MTYLGIMRPEDILKPTPAGLCSAIGGFHIDPVRPVDKALITHGHSDHARPGHGAVLATQETLDMMRLRYGDNFAGTTQAIRYGDRLKLGKTDVSFHPAGHVLGSAQICVAAGGTRVVASGDYKDVADPTCLRRSSWCHATPSSPRRRSGCRCSATAIRARKSPSCCARSSCFPSAGIWSAPIRSARRSASSR